MKRSRIPFPKQIETVIIDLETLNNGNQTLTLDAITFIANLWTRGVMLVVITLESASMAIARAKEWKIHDLVYQFIGRESVRAHPPDPEIIYRALEFTASTKGKSLVLTRKPSLIESASKAGVACVVVRPEILNTRQLSKITASTISFCELLKKVK